MSALPAAVRKQVDQANQLLTPTLSGNEPVPPTPPEPPAVVDETPPAPPPAPNAPPEELPVETSYEQRYKVLQGKYNAEVPRLTSQVRELSTELASMKEQLVATQSLLSSVNPPAGAATGTRLVTDEEVKEFGPDLYDFVKRASREAAVPEIEARVRPITQRVEQASSAVTSITRESARTAEDRMYALLSEQVPNWLQLNEDPVFLAWLNERDPFSGELRGNLLRQAHQRHDGPRVVAFFKSFQNENATVAPPAPAATTVAPQRPLEELVAPGSSRAPSAGAHDGAGKRIWTRTEIANFYRDLSAGKYSRELKKAKAIENDIFAAQSEGRIR